MSFSPEGDLLAITSGRSLLLWDYMHDRRDGNRPAHADYEPVGPGIPREILEGDNPFHMVDFHPSGNLLMTGEKNRYSTNSHSSTAMSEEQQFTLRLVIHRFDRRIDRKFADPVLVVPRAVAYNDAGIHFSPCGTMLAACIPNIEGNAFQIAVMTLVASDGIPVGTVIYQTPLDRGHVTALTNLKFSSTSQHLLAGFSFRPTNPVLRGHAEHYDATAGQRGGLGGAAGDRWHVPQVRVVDIYQVGANFELIRSLCADMDVSDGNGSGAEDEINVAVFAPVTGAADGVVYGTQKGRIRMFQQATGPVSKLAAAAVDGDDERAVEWTGEEANRWRDGATRGTPGAGRTRAAHSGSVARARGHVGGSSVTVTRSRAASTRGDGTNGNGRESDLPSRYNSV